MNGLRCQWNSTAIKRMHKQWKPGPFFPSLSLPGNKARAVKVATRQRYKPGMGSFAVQFVTVIIIWGEPHTSVTSLHPCVCMFACLYAWTNHLP